MSNPLLTRKASMRQAQRQMRSGAINHMSIGKALQNDIHSQYVATNTPRQYHKGQSKPRAFSEPSRLEIAYRAQASKIFRAPMYEKKHTGLTALEMMMPNRSMSLDEGFKIGDFQPVKKHPNTGQNSVQLIRDSHSNQSRGSGQMGFPPIGNTTPMDTSFDEVNKVSVKPRSNKRQATESGFFDGGDFSMSFAAGSSSSKSKKKKRKS